MCLPCRSPTDGKFNNGARVWAKAAQYLHWARHALSCLITLLVQPIAKDQRSNGSQYTENHGNGLS